MKAYAEHIVENSIKGLLQTLQRNVTDTGAALDMYEMTHNDYECDQSKQYSALVAGHFALQEAIQKINDQLNKSETMDRRKIYDLLCDVIKEAELGKKECIKEDFKESSLCDHAWENLENLVAEIGKVITAEDRAVVESRRVEALTVNVDTAHGSFNHLP